MSFDFIKFAFVGGEVSDAYAGRSDLEKFDLALLEAENWQVDYLGGLSNSPGTLFCEPIENDHLETKLFPFKFSGDEANTNLILFGSGYIRFLQGGAYVLEPNKTITGITAANPVVITAVGHGFATGNLVQLPDPSSVRQLANRTFKITVLGANTFSLQDIYGTNVNGTAHTAYTSGGTVARVYTVGTSYPTSAYADLRAHQIRDVVRLTHPDYPTHNLTRLAQASWTFTPENYDRGIATPVISSATVHYAGGYGMGYVVTAVKADGTESLPSDYRFVDNSEDPENNPVATIGLRWSPIDGAVSYNIYRTRIAQLISYQTITRSMQVGYIGQASGAYFLDTGIIPDFAKTVPQGNNPFSDASITYVTVTNGGTGYANTDTITVTDATGSGFIGYPVTSNHGAATGPIAGVIIHSGGKDYTAPTLTLVSAGGSGAVLTATLRADSGNNPSLAAVYQQRQLYAAPLNAPLTVYGSKPGQLSNFDVSKVLIASDSFEHEVDSEDLSPLIHIIPTRGGLLLMSKAGIWLMAGSSGNAITATDVQAEPQTYTGVSRVEPLKIDTDILYCSATGRRVNTLAYADQYKLYSPTDISILASHLFERFGITRWAYANEPHRLIHAIRADGTMLLLTMVKEQEIYAWTRRVTKGQFLDVVSLEESADTGVYVVTKRYIGGRFRKYVEKIAPRIALRDDESVFLDSAVKLSETYGTGALTIAAASGNGIQCVSTVAEFSVLSVDKIIRYGRSKMRVASYVNTTTITVNIIDEITDVIPFTSPATPKRAEVGEWTIDAETLTVDGCFHLEGETITALADGNVIKNLVVTAGRVTLPQAASRVIVGVPYVSKARNMPLAIQGEVIENKVKNITHIVMRLRKSRGLKGGTALDALYPVKPQMHPLLGEANKAQDGSYTLAVEPIWGVDSSAYFVQDEPLPVTILGYVLETEIGDDPN